MKHMNAPPCGQKLPVWDKAMNMGESWFNLIHVE